MDPLVQRISELVGPARHIVATQLARLQQLQARLHGCPEVTPAALARTLAGGDGAARVREVTAGIRDVIFALEVATQDITSCIKDARDHDAYDATLLPDLSGYNDEQVHEFLVDLQIPITPTNMAELFCLILFSFSALRFLLDYRLARVHTLVRRVGVQPQQPGVVQMAHTHLALAVTLATRISDAVLSISNSCDVDIVLDMLNDEA